LYWRDGITWHCAPLNPYAPQNVRGSLVYEPATHKIFYLSDDHNKIWNYWHDIVWYAAPLNPQAPSPSPKQRVVYSDTPDAPASVFYVGIGEGVSGPPYYGPIHRLYWQGAEGLPPNGEVQGMADLDADFVPLPNGWSEGTAGGSVAGEAGRDNSFGLTNPVGLAGTDCRIMYEVPNGPARVGLQLYDVQGRLVRTLVDGEERQGPQVVTWDGKREDGSRAPKGILLIRLEVNGETRTGKLPVVK
jgi:hypothetical protein